MMIGLSFLQSHNGSTKTTNMKKCSCLYSRLISILGKYFCFSNTIKVIYSKMAVTYAFRRSCSARCPKYCAGFSFCIFKLYWSRSQAFINSIKFCQYIFNTINVAKAEQVRSLFSFVFELSNSLFRILGSFFDTNNNFCFCLLKLIKK